MPTGWVERCARTAAGLSRETKISIAMAVDAVAVPVLLVLAVTLRQASLSDALSLPIALYVIAGALTVTAFWLIGLYRAVFRFITQGALVTAALGVALAAIMLAAVSRLLFGWMISINSIIIFGLLLLLYLVVCRSLVREAFSPRNGTRARVIIYGAGVTGAQLARSLRDGGQYSPVAFVDADVTLQGSVVAGIPVYPPDQLTALIKRKRISCVLLAIPSCSRRRRHAILKSLELQPVCVRTVPDVSDIVSGHATVADVREVDANDLLGREPVAPDQALLGGCIHNKVVMVSGAGGSIGSELCRQILRQGPRRLVLLEISEHALYQIERELRASPPVRASTSNSCRCSATRGIVCVCARSCRSTACRPCITRPRTSTCRSSSRTCSRAFTTTCSARVLRRSSARVQGRNLRADLYGQGGQSDQRDGRDQAACRADAAGAAGALLVHALLHGALR